MNEPTDATGNRDRWLPSTGPARDAAFVAVVAFVALLLRIVNLSATPSGLHGDEAVTGLDAARILDGQQVFPYTAGALGQPSGFMYVVAPFVRVMGQTIEAVRLPSALLGTLTVVVAFYAVRELFGRPAAWIAAVLLAFSSWLLFYNRAGYPVTVMPLTEVASLLAVAVAVRTLRWYWAIVAGAVVGAGIYGYYSYPLFAVALGVYVMVMWLIERPAPLITFARQAAIIGGVALAVTYPMWPYLFSDERGYQHDRAGFTVAATPEYKAADSAGRVRIYRDQTLDVVRTLTYHGIDDSGDATGTIPALDPMSVTLGGAGIAFCVILAVRRRRAAYLLPLIVIPPLMVGPVMSISGTHRRALGVLPFVVIGASVLLAEAWEAARARHPGQREWATGALAVLLVAYGAVNTNRYFSDMMGSTLVSTIYAPALTEAIRAIEREPADTHVYWAADSWSAWYETVQYLSPRHSVEKGNLEDRSGQFSPDSPGLESFDRTRPTTVMLVGNYVGADNYMIERYPGSTHEYGPAIDGLPMYVIFRLPALP